MTFGPGDVFLAEDVTGQGRRRTIGFGLTCTLDNANRSLPLNVQLPGYPHGEPRRC
jgi:hypothetical protein